MASQRHAGVFPNTIARVAALARLLFESVPAGVLENEHCPTLATS